MPSLAADLRALADRADTLEPAELCGALEALKVRVWTAALAPNGAAPSPHGSSRLLDVEEAAARLSVSADWVYRHAKQLPFTRRVGRRALRFDPDGLVRWLAHRTPRR
jgi:predicted DNA-binding transcriptional regulator AlpA